MSIPIKVALIVLAALFLLLGLAGLLLLTQGRGGHAPQPAAGQDLRTEPGPDNADSLPKAGEALPPESAVIPSEGDDLSKANAGTGQDGPASGAE